MQSAIHKIHYVSLAAMIFALASVPALAQQPQGQTQQQSQDLFGTPVVMPSGHLMLNGTEITLWGISPLAADQQCWRGEVAWNCGQQSLQALSMYTEGHVVRCVAKGGGGGAITAQCFRQDGKDKEGEDLARYMIEQGWARDHREVSGGIYAYDQQKAWNGKHGVWNGRFQTAEDWHNGVRRYVDYQPTEEDRRRDRNLISANGVGAPADTQAGAQSPSTTPATASPSSEGPVGVQPGNTPVGVPPGSTTVGVEPGTDAPVATEPQVTAPAAQQPSTAATTPAPAVRTHH
jgi:endonuclease YncB( thermonuclease family)